MYNKWKKPNACQVRNCSVQLRKVTVTPGFSGSAAPGGSQGWEGHGTCVSRWGNILDLLLEEPGAGADSWQGMLLAVTVRSD